MLSFPVLNLKVCQACYDRVSADELPDITLDELLEIDDIDKAEKLGEAITDKYNQINRSILCNLCAFDHQLSYARRQGKKDPFEAYENTLTYKERDIIEKLRKYLLERIDFKQSVITTDQKALFINDGYIKEPLLITIYYVMDTDQQNHILELIDAFFKTQKKTQRKVIFIEKENWIKEEHYSEEHKIKSVSHHRGEETIIKTITIK